MSRIILVISMLLFASNNCEAQDTFTTAQREEISRMLSSEVESARIKIILDLCNEFAEAGTVLPKSCTKAYASSKEAGIASPDPQPSPSVGDGADKKQESFNQALFFGRVQTTTLDRDVDGASNRVEFTNSKDGGRASIRLSDTNSNSGTDGDKRFIVRSATLSTPLEKDSDKTQLMTADGFANATTLELRLGVLRVRGARSPRNKEGLVAAAAKLYERAGLDPLKQYDLGLVWSALSDSGKLYLYPEFESLYWAGDASRLAYGGVLKLGTDTYKFIPIGTTNLNEEERIPFGLGIYGGFLPRGRSDLYFGGGLEFQRAYKPGKTQTICPTNAPGATVQCITAAYGRPSEQENHLVYIEARKAFDRFSFSAKATHDFNNNATKLDIPFFLFTDPEAKFSSGFRVGWSNEDAFSFGVFVSNAFDFGANPSP